MYFVIQVCFIILLPLCEVLGVELEFLQGFCFTFKVDWSPHSINTKDLGPCNGNHVFAKSCRQPLGVIEAHRPILSARHYSDGNISC